MQLFTIGHSNREMHELLALLRGNDIELLADVRRFPGSRRLPRFNQETLRDALAASNIDYLWFEALGGRRSGYDKAMSPNLGLRVKGFRQYADYMQSDAFQTAVEQLLEQAALKRTALMCAEAVYWRCHR